jgi:hypothetical protein
MHPGMADLGLPEIGHTTGPLCFMLDNRRRTFRFWPQDLTEPHRKPIHHASGHGFQTPRLPGLVAFRQAEQRSALDAIKVVTDQRRFFQPHPILAHEVGHTARRIDPIKGTVRRARSRDDDLNDALQSFLENHYPGDTRVGRTGVMYSLKFALRRSGCRQTSRRLLPRCAAAAPAQAAQPPSVIEETAQLPAATGVLQLA